MKLYREGDTFIAATDYGEWGAKNAGFRWDASGKVWKTKSIEKAARIKDAAAPDLKAELEAHLESERSEMAAARERSRATDANVDIPSPEGLEYLPYQRAGIAFALEREATLLGDEMGLGKTIQAIGIINATPDMKRVLVICPASLRLNWARELRKWLVRCLSVGIAFGPRLPGTDIVVCNYDILGRHRLLLGSLEWDLLVVDECFPAGTIVETDRGPLPIDQIVNDRLPVQALSVSSDNEVEYKSVTRYIRKPQPETLLRISHSHGELVCTPNHEIQTSNGYASAEEIAVGDRLRMVRGNIRIPGISGAPVLQHTVRGSLESKARTAITGSSETERNQGGEHKTRDEEAGCLGTYEATEFRPGISRQTGGRVETSERPIMDRAARGQRDDYPPAGVAVRGSKAARRSDGVRDTHRTRQASLRQSSDLLQSRSGYSRTQAGYRGGREKPQAQKMEVSRPPQGISTESVRVVSIEVLERGSGQRSQDSFVYNIEVAGNHNYFADGILVGNCHYLKNPKALRTKAVLGAWHKEKAKRIKPIQAKRRLFLTGTPIVNRPIELHPILKSIDNKRWGNRFEYAKRYCSAYHNGYGWDFSGASHLDELQDKLRSTCMVRRLKADVLTDLPAKRRQVIEIPANGASDVIAEEQAIAAKHESRMATLRVTVELAKASDDPRDYDRAVEKLIEGQREEFAEIAKARKRTAIAKAPYVIDHINDILESGDTKVVLFTHHHEVTDQFLAEFGSRCVKLDGRNSMVSRDASVTRFQTDDHVRVFIGGIKAAGVGLTLTASAHVVFAELDWVPGNMTQAEDRCHRIGQVNSVLVQHLVLEGSIDARMANTLVSKQAVIDKALDIEEDEAKRTERVEALELEGPD